MTFNEISEYEVTLRNGEGKYVVADDCEHTDDDLFFFQGKVTVAWFNPHDIIGYIKVKELSLVGDGKEKSDETETHI